MYKTIALISYRYKGFLQSNETINIVLGESENMSDCISQKEACYLFLCCTTAISRDPLAAPALNPLVLQIAQVLELHSLIVQDVLSITCTEVENIKPGLCLHAV